MYAFRFILDCQLVKSCSFSCSSHRQEHIPIIPLDLLVGPLDGTVIAVLLYKLIKALEDDTAQDGGEDEKSILLTSERREPEAPSHGSLSIGSAGSAAPAQGSSQHIAPRTYAKTPVMGDGGS